MTLYPIFLDLTDRPVLVVGGGRVAARKVQALRDSGASITVVAPQFCDEFESLAACSSLTLLERGYLSADVQDKRLVISAADDEKVNKQVSGDCQKHNIICNVVDQPELCDFHVPARVKRGLLQIAISTGGASPAMAKRIRKRLEKEFGPGYDTLMSGLLELREHLQSSGPAGQAERQRILEAFLDSEVPDQLLDNGDISAFNNAIEQWKRKELK